MHSRSTAAVVNVCKATKKTARTSQHCSGWHVKPPQVAKASHTLGLCNTAAQFPRQLSLASMPRHRLEQRCTLDVTCMQSAESLLQHQSSHMSPMLCSAYVHDAATSHMLVTLDCWANSLRPASCLCIVFRRTQHQLLEMRTQECLFTTHSSMVGMYNSACMHPED
jgi:hypothetical protein